MKKTLLRTLFSISLFMTVCSAEISLADYNPFSSDRCEVIDKKILKLDQFSQTVENTSASHLEEKLRALGSPGIAISSNKKKMLRDAKRKRTAYLAERQAEGCDTPVVQSSTSKTEGVTASESVSSSDVCEAIDSKILKLDQFTYMVKNTSAFHLEEKANAIRTPGITVSNNKKQMLKDADKKYAEYAAEHKKYGCKKPITTSTSQIADVAVATAPARSSQAPVTTVKKPAESEKPITRAEDESTVKAAALPVVEKSTSDMRESTTAVTEKKEQAVSVESQTRTVTAPVTAESVPKEETKSFLETSIFSSNKCDDIDQALIELAEFTSMVNSTSAFHLQEKASALPSPGFTVSNNKKKMLRDINKRHAELLAERKKYGCDPL